MANRKLLVTGTLLLVPLFSLNSMAQLSGDAATKAVTERRAIFKQLAETNQTIAQMSRPGGTYNEEAALKAFDTIVGLAEKIPASFEPNTVGYKDPKPGRYAANDSVWANKADFNKLAADLAAAAKQARESVKTEGAAGLAAAMRTVGGKCGACHDRYRVDL